MGSSNLNFNNFGTHMPPEAIAASGGRRPRNLSLPRQPSIYSLTFGEFQNTVGSFGKDFGSMNMDELLKTLWNAEENQNIGSTSNHNDSCRDHGSGYLQRQVSLTIPRTLSQKTVDEVWRDVVKEYGGEKDTWSGTAGGFGVVHHRQPTLGEVTLEEFLVRAGVVKEETRFGQEAKDVDLFGNLLHPVNNFGGGGYNSNLPLDLNGAQSAEQQQQTAHTHQQQQLILPKQPTLEYGCGIVGLDHVLVQNVTIPGLGANDGGISVVTGSPGVSSDGVAKSNGDISSISPVPCVFNGGSRGRKSGALEKVVERRQRRMIKNRESAARSRDRKQVYTMELEAKVAKLKEENELLQKKQAEMLEMQKNQEVLEEMNHNNGNKRRCLRRTQTGPW
ncbi:ARM REPEAT PROTEIN INTERACTING WITH abf2 [Orobanche minor]